MLSRPVGRTNWVPCFRGARPRKHAGQEDAPMANQHRKRCKSYNIPGQAHELTFSCFRRLPLLSRDRTRRWFVDAMEAARREQALSLWAYVIMPEHVHLLLCPRERDYEVRLVCMAFKVPVERKAVQ